MYTTIKAIAKVLPFLFSLVCLTLNAREASNTSSDVSITVEWAGQVVEGEIKVKYGSLKEIQIISGHGRIRQSSFSFKGSGGSKIEVTFEDVNIGPGSGSTLVTVMTKNHPFSFFLRDVTSAFPIYIPEYNVVVTPAADSRALENIKEDLLNMGLVTKLAQYAAEPEASFANAARITRDQPCPTWLGTSRDTRTFTVSYALKNQSQEMEIITPRLASSTRKIDVLDGREVSYGFVTGRGQGPVLDVKRRLEEGVLPILHTTLQDEDITYHSVCFTSMEYSALTADKLHGTHFLEADSQCFGHMFTEAQKEALNEIKLIEKSDNEETVLYFRSEAINNTDVPRYAWFKTIRPGRGWWADYEWTYDKTTGFSRYDDDNIFCVSKLNGRPMPDEEVAILIQPGAKAVFEFYLPHAPVSAARALMLSEQEFNRRYFECRDFWKEKLSAGPVIELPEKRIEEMMQAGLLHLDMVTYGEEPSGTLAPTIGVYSPIGTESAPIIQYYNSMGWTDVARRSLQYFLDKQHEDGMMQNFGGYMVETGAALWSMGEYFRYTQDTAWVMKNRVKFLKASEFLLNWREEHITETLRGKGYGMIAGKVADPEDQHHQFMLNAYAYLGLARVVEMLSVIDKKESDGLSEEVKAWKEDIKTAISQSMANSPVVPLGDGTWCPTVPPWTESTGPQLLFVDRGNAYSHGTFTARDVMLGPMYLAFCEVIDPDDEITNMLLNYHSELFFQDNGAFSQPYYSRHAWLQLKKGMVKPFLKTYYTTMSALADRETYTFWEHLYHAASHKTHEEAWFLMQTRWMLYMEEGNTLNLLSGIPRDWLEAGKTIRLGNVVSYFGPISVNVQVNREGNTIQGSIQCLSDRKPQKLSIRLPHPDYKKAQSVEGGTYNAEAEVLLIDEFAGRVEFKVDF